MSHKERYKIILSLCTLTCQLSAQVVTFDAEDYASVGVYDAWEQSPFRTGQLAGNAAVVPNPFTDVDAELGFAPNTTANVLALQRSRFGSNTFGVRINLKEPFRLTKASQYLHVMVQLADKPASSRMMAIGLGRRVEEEWAWQTGEDEQFWALSTSDVAPSDGWQDVVFAFKGFSYRREENAESGIDIYSLVLIPDVRSPHADSQDFACYFDELAIDGSSARRFSTEYYPIGFDKSQKPTRTDRHLDSVGLRGGSDGTQTATGLSSLIYNDKTSTTLFSAKPGESLRPVFTYTGVWMSAYVYVDWGGDGNFSDLLADNMRPAEGSDVVSYNALEHGGRWYKSDGSTVSNGNQITAGVPSFTIPATMPAGFYRMRYKVDWNSIDPAGNTAPENHIVANGGGITDVMLDVHTDKVRVSDQQLNGAILAADGSELNNFEADYGKPFTIRMAPAPGFAYSGITVRYGYNLDGEAVVRDNPQYFVVSYDAADFDEDDSLTLPASLMRGGDVRIEGFFVEVPQPDKVTGVGNRPSGDGDFYDLSGRTLGQTSASRLPLGIYVQKGHKLLVR